MSCSECTCVNLTGSRAELLILAPVSRTDIDVCKPDCSVLDSDIMHQFQSLL